MRYLFGLLLLSLLSFSLPAQSMYWGLKVGASLSKTADFELRSSNSDESLELTHNSVLKKHAGFWMENLLNGRFTLQTELLWTQQAFKPLEPILPSRNEVHTEFNYFSIPLLLHYEFIPNLSVAMGPQVSFLIIHRLREEALTIPNPSVTEDAYWELGLNLELGYQLDRIRLGLRAQTDLTPFLKMKFTDVNGEAVSEVGFRHQALHLWLGYEL